MAKISRCACLPPGASTWFRPLWSAPVGCDGKVFRFLYFGHAKSNLLIGFKVSYTECAVRSIKLVFSPAPSFWPIGILRLSKLPLVRQRTILASGQFSFRGLLNFLALPPSFALRLTGAAISPIAFRAEKGGGTHAFNVSTLVPQRSLRLSDGVKSQASETALPIPTALIAILKEYRAQWKPNPQGFLFVTRNGRPPSSNKVVEYHLWTILDALGLDARIPGLRGVTWTPKTSHCGNRFSGNVQVSGT